MKQLGSILALVRSFTSPKQEGGGGMLTYDGVGANGLIHYTDRITEHAAPHVLVHHRPDHRYGRQPVHERLAPFELLAEQETGLASYVTRFGRAAVYGADTSAARRLRTTAA